MRQPGSFIVALTFCCAAFSLESAAVIAQENAPQDGSRSTIRLCTATEPVRDSAPTHVAPQEPAPAVDQDAPPEPISQTVDTQSAERAEPINQNDNGGAPASVAPTAAPRQRMPAGFYPNESVRAALRQAPGRVPIQPAPRLQTKRPGGKPFQSLPTQPSVSPYLYLSAGGNNANLVTNYFGFVRPQLDQMEASRQQQRKIQQLESQMKKMSAAGAGQQAADGPSAAHYMDTAQFYRGLQR
jgi:hypothetical protein